MSTVKQDLVKMERMNYLEDQAISRYLDKTDFDRTEWMTDIELNEYIKIYKEIHGECPTCGQASDCPDCTCETNNKEGK